MARERKVTREIAGVIHKSYKNLRLAKVEYKEALKIIQFDVLDEFGVELGLGTVKNYAAQSFDKLEEANKRYAGSVRGKVVQRRYRQKMIKPRNKNIPMTIDVFTGLDVELSAKQVWEKVGGDCSKVSNNLKLFYEADVLKRRKIGESFAYSLNPDSPFIAIADGFFEEKEERMFGTEK